MTINLNRTCSYAGSAVEIAVVTARLQAGGANFRVNPSYGKYESH
jgi:hypothetical protein